MDKQITGAKEYATPTVVELGTIAELTQKPRPPKPNKCGGSGDSFLPTTLSEEFSTMCPGE